MKGPFGKATRAGDEIVVERPEHLLWPTGNVMDGNIATVLVHPGHVRLEHRFEIKTERISQDDTSFPRARRYFDRIVDVGNQRLAAPARLV